jgi:hypothetical protein
MAAIPFDTRTDTEVECDSNAMTIRYRELCDIRVLDPHGDLQEFS